MNHDEVVRILVEAANRIDEVMGRAVPITPSFAKPTEEAYRRKLAEIHGQVRSLTYHLKAHEARQRRYPGHWGYVADLGRISDALKSALDEVARVVEDRKRE